MSKLSIIIPALNEEHVLLKQQQALSMFLQDGHEMILVDGGSEDNTVHLAKQLGFKTIVTKASRGYQLKAGSDISKYETLLFLHADTQVPHAAIQVIQNALSSSDKLWGRFNVSFNNNDLIYRVIAFFMNLRSCLTGIVTGDHAMFITKDAYRKCGGFSDMPIMEDIDICKRLRRISKPICLKNRVITSCRKWESNGIFLTILKMWSFRLMYFFGASPEKLAKLY